MSNDVDTFAFEVHVYVRLRVWCEDYIPRGPFSLAAVLSHSQRRTADALGLLLAPSPNDSPLPLPFPITFYPIPSRHGTSLPLAPPPPPFPLTPFVLVWFPLSSLNLAMAEQQGRSEERRAGLEEKPISRLPPSALNVEAKVTTPCESHGRVGRRWRGRGGRGE